MQRLTLKSTLALAGLTLLLATTAAAQGPGPRRSLDADRDGVITREEASSAAAEAAARLDKDGDGTISVQEYTESRLGWFDRLDRNGDGVLDKSEQPRRHGRRGARGATR
ncbi:MAG TPA: hypothetical protein VF406_04795 [Thermodesulfobacteriota bacterium]